MWSGLERDVAVVPSPPPSWPTITSEVSVTAVGRLFVNPIVRLAPVGTVITTGDQVPAGFNAAQVAPLVPGSLQV